MATSRTAGHLGRVLGGRYRLIAAIGTGASGQVYLADDVVLRRRVAVKVLHPALAGDEGFLRRFRAEAQAAAALSHPNIMAVHDWGEEADGEPFLVLEYLGGGSLRAMLDRGHLLTPSQALLVGLETARALEYAHRRGFVHRDVKPANLLFGDDGRLRVADFGLARALAEAAWTEPSGAVLGTARYASPEQVRGERVDGKADVYALALVLIEAVTGEVPFTADTTIATLMARVDRPLVVPDGLGAMASSLERAGRPAPADRPDAGELAVSLLAAAEELPRPERLPLVGALTDDDITIAIDRDPTMHGEETGTIDLTGPTPTVTPGRDAEPQPSWLERRRASREERRVRRIGARHRRWPVVGTILVLVLLAGAAAGYALFADRVPSYTVPNLETGTVAEAERAVDRFEWEIETVKDRKDGTRPGEIIAQDPAAGEQLDEGGTLRLTVSEGNQLAPVPSLVGKPEAQARTLIERAGFKVGKVTKEFSEDKPPGTVLKHTSGTGDPRQLPKQAAVNLIVSDGPAPRTIPDLRNATWEEASKALTDLKLKPIRQDDFHGDIEPGRVIGTGPGFGNKVPRDSEVRVSVSKGPEMIAIPRVRGMTATDAAERLEAAGFVVEDVDGPPNADAVGTSPPEGEKRERGTGVTIITRRRGD